MTLVSAIASRAAVTSSSSVGRLIAVECQLRQPDSIGRPTQRLALQRADHLAAQPPRRRHAEPPADDLTEQRMVEPHVDTGVVLLDDPDQATALGLLDRIGADDAPLNVSRLSGSQNVSSRSVCSTSSGS